MSYPVCFCISICFGLAYMPYAVKVNALNHKIGRRTDLIIALPIIILIQANYVPNEDMTQNIVMGISANALYLLVYVYMLIAIIYIKRTASIKQEELNAKRKHGLR